MSLYNSRQSVTRTDNEELAFEKKTGHDTNIKRHGGFGTYCHINTSNDKRGASRELRNHITSKNACYQPLWVERFIYHTGY